MPSCVRLWVAVWLLSALAMPLSAAPRDELLAAKERGLGLMKQGRYPEAIAQLERAVALAPQAFGREGPETAILLNALGMAHFNLNQYETAEPLFLRVLKITEARRDAARFSEAASVLNNLATVYSNTGDYARAERAYRRSLQIKEQQLGPNEPSIATGLNNLAAVYSDMGQYEKAEPLYQRSLRIYEGARQRDDALLASAVNNLANLYRDMGQYTQAEPLYQRSLKLREARLGKDHPDLAFTLNNLAGLYNRLERTDEAEQLYRRALAIREKRLGPDHPSVATTLNSLGLLYSERGEYAEAEKLYQRSLEIKEAQLGKGHPNLAATLQNLAALYKATGDPAKAKPLYERSIAINRTMGPDHPDVAKSLYALAALHVQMEQWDEARDGVDGARRIFRRHTSRVLPGLSESQQLAFLKATDESSFHGALSLARMRREDAGMAEISAGWVLNGKGVTQQALAERILVARDSTNPALAPVVNGLLAVRRQLATMTLAPIKPGEEQATQAEMQQLTSQEQELSKRFGQASGRAEQADPWIELDAVRAALPADALLVEIARFGVRNFATSNRDERWQAPRYAAWIIPAAGQGEVRIVDLGNAEGVDAAVQAVRTALLEGPALIRENGEPEAQAALAPALAQLAQRVLAPWADELEGKASLILSPDAALWLVPWAALPLAEERYLIEDHELSYVVSGRTLVDTPAAGEQGKQAIIFADPDYDLSPSAVQTATQSLLGKSTTAAWRLPSAGASTLGRAIRLPGTATEAETIKPKLQSYAEIQPKAYTGQWALEAVFKAVRRPRVMVISTHGFFLPDQELSSDESDERSDRPGQTREGKPLENPLLRCGLLFAGCNEQGATSEDGILTGLELVGADLRGTELVVLSACETGLGQVQNGEGVAGLRQAFQLAGTQGVVATLWQIPDRETAQLMSNFFGALSEGQTKTAALRTAQRMIIESRRERSGAAHPFFWAAFTLTGR